MAKQELETRRLNGDFGVDLDELIGNFIHYFLEIVESYQNRQFDEDILILRKDYEGVENLSQKLGTSVEKGLNLSDLDFREAEFGTNK